MTSHRALIITYYWPPAGGVGVQRWLNFTRYMSEFGWQPTVYAPLDAKYPIFDETLEAKVAPGVEVVRRPIIEARSFYLYLKKLRHPGRDEQAFKPEMDSLFHRSNERLTRLQKFGLIMRSNFFIPDSRRFWIAPSIRYLKKWLRRNPVDVIVTTGPPHSCHLIGLALSRSTRLPWLADFRDPWTDIEYFPRLKLSKQGKKKHFRLQHKVLSSADMVVTVSPFWSGLLRTHGADHVEVVTNGFTPEDFAGLSPERDNGVFRIGSIGTFEMDRDSRTFWSAIEQFKEDLTSKGLFLEIHFAGKVDFGVFNNMPPSLKPSIVRHDYLPHKQALKLMMDMDVLLLLLNRSSQQNELGRIPAKMYEYMATGNNILLLGDSNSDAAQILTKFDAGLQANFDDGASICKALVELGERRPKLPTGTRLSVFERRNLTRSMCAILDSVL